MLEWFKLWFKIEHESVKPDKILLNNLTVYKNFKENFRPLDDRIEKNGLHVRQSS